MAYIDLVQAKVFGLGRFVGFGLGRSKVFLHSSWFLFLVLKFGLKRCRIGYRFVF